jgi:hypothetical protein
MSYPWKLDIVAALPCRVKGRPGSSIKTFFFSKPRARSAKPRPLLKPQVTMLWEGAHWIPPASARYAAISCRNSSSPRGFGYTGGALISARTARVRILANGLAGKVSCAGGPIWKTAGCAVSSWYSPSTNRRCGLLRAEQRRKVDSRRAFQSRLKRRSVGQRVARRQFGLPSPARRVDELPGRARGLRWRP